MTTVKFYGNAPVNIDYSPFYDVTSTIYYPARNETRSEEVMQRFGGELTWVLYDKIVGDIDDNFRVDVDDVLALLWNVLFPEDYPIEAEADFDGNGVVDVDDVLALLWHVLFPDEYPI